MIIDITSDIPFEIPDSWAWVRVKTISNYGDIRKSKNDGFKPGSCILDLEDIESYSSKLLLKRRITNKDKILSQKHKFNKGDVLISKLRMYLKKVILADEDGFCSSEIMPCSFEPYCINAFARYFFISSYLLHHIEKIEYGCKMPRLGTQDAKDLFFPLPPKTEQIKIVSILDHCFKSIDELSKIKNDCKNLSVSLKNQVLNFYFSSSDKSHYKQVKLETVLSYIQPGPFIVKKPIYSPSFKTPVLTPGKTFVLGYTDEKEGIFKTKGRSVIIFDDFTTASRLVDFDFKVKSSAMKILITDESKNDINYLYYMLQTIKINSDTHKRFWISEYAPCVVFLPDKENQKKIADNIKMLFLLIDKLSVC